MVIRMLNVLRGRMNYHYLELKKDRKYQNGFKNHKKAVRNEEHNIRNEGYSRKK